MDERVVKFHRTIIVIESVYGNGCKYGHYVILFFMLFCDYLNIVLCGSEENAVGITAYMQCGVLSA